MKMTMLGTRKQGKAQIRLVPSCPADIARKPYISYKLVSTVAVLSQFELRNSGHKFEPPSIPFYN